MPSLDFTAATGAGVNVNAAAGDPGFDVRAQTTYIHGERSPIARRCREANSNCPINIGVNKAPSRVFVRRCHRSLEALLRPKFAEMMGLHQRMGEKASRERSNFNRSKINSILQEINLKCMVKNKFISLDSHI